MTGFFYYNEHRYNTGVDGIVNIILGRPQVEMSLIRLRKYWRGIADLTSELTDKLSALGGLRYSHDQISAVAEVPLNGTSAIR